MEIFATGSWRLGAGIVDTGVPFEVGQVLNLPFADDIKQRKRCNPLLLLPALFLLLLRPELVGNAVDVFIAQNMLPRWHIKRRSWSGGIVHGGHPAIANNRDHFILGVIVRDMNEPRNLTPLG